MFIHYPFPTAVHTYFRAVNKHDQKQLFLAGIIDQPEFIYKGHWTQELIEQRLEATKNDDLAWSRLKVVQSSLRLREDANELSAFRAVNAAIFRSPNEELTEAIICRISQNITQLEKPLWKEILTLLGTQSLDRVSVEPSDAVFQKYKKYLRQYTTIPTLGVEIQDALRTQLKLTGLEDKGWRLRVIEGAEHAHTHHKTKTISIGADYTPRSLSAVQRIAVHEVLGHAVRGPQQKLEESEGFAIVLEQLTKPSFAFRRTYRYLAVALGWGVLGGPRNFREVHEILWRLMVIQSKYSVEIAKQYAFDECYRAFRGGRPDIAGAVFLKDAVYFSANIRMWKVLMKQELSYNEFKDIIEGRRTVLS